MDFSDAFAISAAGMSVERLRVEVAAANLANADTVQLPDGTRYQPQRVVIRLAGAAPAAAFAARIDASLGESERLLAARPLGTVEPTADAPRLVLDPGHPFANEAGQVAYPAVNAATEMMAVMSAVRAYEANVAAMNAARSIALEALEIGGNS